MDHSRRLRLRHSCVCGRFATRLGIAEWIAAVPPASNVRAARALDAFAEAERDLAEGRAVAAEAHLRQALKENPGHGDAANRLAYLLGVEGRCWEAEPLLRAAVRQGRFTLHHLVLLGALEPVIRDPALVELCQHRKPPNTLPLLGVARTAIKQGQREQAASLLQQIVAGHPDCSEAQARLGSLLLDGSPAAFLDWHERLPATANEHPEIWLVRGGWARDHDDLRGAVRCFLQAARLDPNHQLAHMELGRLFHSLGDAEHARQFSERGERLRQLGILVDEVYKDPQNPQLMHRAAELCEVLGRLWEARGWAQTALQLDPNLPWARQAIHRWHASLGEGLACDA